MNFLFFVGDLYPNLNATNKIAYQLGKYLSESGHYVLMLGANYNEEFENKINENFTLISKTPQDLIALSVKKFNDYLKHHDGKRHNLVRKFTVLHPFSALCVNYSYSEKYQGKSKLCKDMIEDMFAKEAFDYIVCFQEPSWAENVMMQCNIPDSKKVIYQTDPYGLHQLCSEEQRKKQQSIEIENFKKVTHIFTTVLLEEEYSKNPDYSKFSFKITGVEFPNIRKLNVSNTYPSVFSKEDINIVFLGLLDDSYRSPEKFLSALSSRFSNFPYIKLHFWGDITSNSVFDYMEKYPDNIFIHQSVDSDTALSIQQHADFLLNIGNTVSNQVPSKIFDYFSIGKPIINIQKISNCPARRYIDRYPVAYTFEEFTPDIDKMMDFIFECQGKTVDFNEIRQIYNTATVEYVCEHIIKNLS